MSTNQITLQRVFFWMFLLSVYFTVITAFSALQQAYQQQDAPRALWIYVACWFTLLVHYLRQRQWMPTLIQTLAPVAASLVCMLLDVPTRHLLITAAGAAWLAAIASFPVSVAKSIRFDFGRETNLPAYLLANVLISLLILLPLCAGISLIFLRTATGATVFALLLSLWCGLYQSVSTSDRLRDAEILGLSIRVMASAGLLTAIMGSVLYLLFSRWYGLYFFPPRYSPLLGIPAALLCGWGYRWVRKWSRQRKLVST